MEESLKVMATVSEFNLWRSLSIGIVVVSMQISFG